MKKTLFLTFIIWSSFANAQSYNQHISMSMGIGIYKPNDLKNAYTGTLGSLNLKASITSKIYLFSQAMWTESFYFEDELTNRKDFPIRYSLYPNINSIANTLMVGAGLGYAIYQKKRLSTYGELGVMLHQRSKKYPYGLDILVIYREQSFHTIAVPINLGANLGLLKSKKLKLGIEYNGIITKNLNHGLQFMAGWAF